MVCMLYSSLPIRHIIFHRNTHCCTACLYKVRPCTGIRVGARHNIRRRRDSSQKSTSDTNGRQDSNPKLPISLERIPGRNVSYLTNHVFGQAIDLFRRLVGRLNGRNFGVTLVIVLAGAVFVSMEAMNGAG